MIKLNFNDDELTLITDCGCVVVSDVVNQELTRTVMHHSAHCDCHKHEAQSMVQAAWVAASWEFNFPHGFNADASNAYLGELETFITRSSFDKALHFVETFKSIKPLPVRVAA